MRKYFPPLAAAAVAAALAGCASTATQDQPVPAQPGAAPSAQAPTAGAISQQEVDRFRRAVPNRPPTHTDDGRSARSVYFEYDRYEVKPEYRKVLEAHAGYLRANPETAITVEGNTDERGSREYNLALGHRRAESVKQMMKVLGVQEKQVEAVSLGEEKPRRGGHDESSWAENRRGDIVYR